MKKNKDFALITGSGKRIGKEIALSLANKGFNIIIHYNSSIPKDVITEVKDFGVEVISRKLDLNYPEKITHFFDELEELVDSIPVLVNNASVFHRKPFLETSLDLVQESLNVNLVAPFMLIKHIVPFMNQQDNLVVNISDGAGVQPWVSYSAHGISKAGLIHLTKITSRALAPKIRVNCIIPGPMLMVDGMSKKKWEEIYRTVPLQRQGSPHHVSRLIINLLENDYITGSIINIDGGESLISRG